MTAGLSRPALVDRAPLSKAVSSRIEQRTLWLSLWGVVVLAVGSIAWGLVIESDVVILNGVFSLFSLVGGGLSLLAAKLVVRPEDRRFPFGYSHLEPLTHSINGLMVLFMCLYAILNGIEGIRAGGHEVDAIGVVWFGAVTALFCLGIGLYELWVAGRIDSLLVRNDAKTWLMDAVFSAVTLIAFAVLPFLPEPYRSLWARYADPTMVAVLAVLLLPVPLGMLKGSLREVLMMASDEDALVAKLEAVLRQIQAEHDIVRAVHHVVRSGRTVFVEVDILVGPSFALQTVAQQDALRQRIWQATGLTMDQAWLSVALTADPRWT
jgi:cation diffusion facilitator family transporter